ncbi:hypothetical protein CPB85DRAFT_1297009 [Mucidula mucida]|nr:hypothetical protein CPB85DRAFT_1297009 [Mucidula mucida]
MGQCFRLFNIDKCIYSEEVFADVTMDELHSDVFRRDLVRLLAAPNVPFPDDPLELKFQKSPKLMNLPPEIHAQILGHLGKYYDVLAFCLASRYCWAVGLRRLKALWAPFARKECGSWAGDRLIILGDFSEETPSAILPLDMAALKHHYARMRKDALEELISENDFDDSDSEGWDFEGMVDDKVGKLEILGMLEIFRVLYRLAEDKSFYDEEKDEALYGSAT